MRMPLGAYRMLGEAIADAEAIGADGAEAPDPVEALGRGPEGGRRVQASYTIPVSHHVAVEKIRTELMYSRGLTARSASKSRVAAAAIALYYRDVFGREIDEPEERTDPPRRNPPAP